MFLEKTIKTIVDSNSVPGMSWAIVDKRRICSGIYGCKALEPDKIPLGETNIYDLASLTKAVSTTTAVLQLIEKGCLALDTPLKAVLPKFLNSNITFFHLLTHTSGLPGDFEDKHSLSPQKLKEKALNCPLRQTPGSEVVYSDIGFILMGMAIEQIAGSLETYTRDHIFAPLKMARTGYHPMDKALCVPTEHTAERGLIQGVVHDTKAWLLGGAAGSAGLFSTLEDLAHFVRMLLNKGIYDGKKILAAETVESLGYNHTEGLNLPRSLGWNIHEHEGKRYPMHTGFTGPSILLDFERERGLILLTNRVHPTRENTQYLRDRIQLYNEFIALES